jgi:hypothetical protein
MSWVLKAFDDYARSLQRQFDGDRFSTVGASDVGQCARKIYCSKNEGDPDYGVPRNPGHVDTWGAALRGTLIEHHFFVPAMRESYGDKFQRAGEQQKTLTSGFLSATPDGVLTGMPDDALAHLGVPSISGDGSLAIEVKTIDPRVELTAPKPPHVYQCQTQLGLLHELTQHRPEYGLIVYIDASFLDTIREFPIKRDPKIFVAAKARAREIMTARSMADLPPEGWIAGGQECETCPWSHACGHERGRIAMMAKTPPTPEFIGEVAGVAREVKRLEGEAAAATTRYRERRHELVTLLRAHGHRSVVGDGVSISWTSVRARVTYAGDGVRRAARNAGLDLSPFEHTGAPSDRLTISAAPAANRNGLVKEEEKAKARL